MTWRNDLRTVDFAGKKLVGASFRARPFFVEVVELSTGRRLVVHEFPLRDDPFVEDLGRRARKFKVDGFLIGDDYLAQKTSLLDALEAKGPGELVLPYYDTKRAIGETASVRESRAEGGFAVVSVEFTETPLQAPVPVIVDDGARKVSDSADAAATAVDAQLAADYDARGLPSFALASASNAIGKAASFVSAQLAPAIQDTQELAGLNGQLGIIAAQATALARSPATLLTQIRTAIGSLVNTAANAPGAMYAALVAAYSQALETPVIGTTATRQREAANQAALVAALRRVIAIEAARLAPLVPYASIEDATAARDQVAALLDEQAQGAGDTAYPALVTLRSHVLRAVPGAAVFARVVTINRRVSTPSLVLTFELYGSVDQEADVIARNNVRHPGFIAGELKVLSNG